MSNGQRKPNIDKMRRASDRHFAAAAMEGRRRWLASLTPEHRAQHEVALFLGCGECASAAFRAFVKSAREVSDGLARMAPKVDRP